MRQYTESPEVISELKKELHETELKVSKAIVAPISSGSAVIASAEKMNEIGMQHRKMSGVEMEMYSLYEAAKQSQCKPLDFGAKCVVDYGDASKGGEACYTTPHVYYLQDMLFLFCKKRLSEISS